MEERQIVSFSIASQLYGIDILNIREIIKIPEHITELTGSSGEVKGVINLRGDIIPVIDLREKLLNKELNIDKHSNRIIICEMPKESSYVGYIVDDVDKVLRISSSNIDKPNDILQNEAIDVICKFEDKMIILLDSQKVLDDYISELEEKKNV